MLRKYLALLLTVVMILSMTFSSVFASPNIEKYITDKGIEEVISEGEEYEKTLTAFNEANVRALKADDYGQRAYEHIEYLSRTIGARPAGSEKEYEARDYISGVFESIGYKVQIQEFLNEKSKKSEAEEGYKETETVTKHYNVIAEKPGLSHKTIIVGAHYDSVTRQGSLGADDNGSGVGIMLEVAEILAEMDTPYTVKFIAFAAEEIGLKGSRYYVENMTEEEIADTVAMINIDTCIAGDFAYVYGGYEDDPEGGWIRDKALELAQNLGLDLRTNPGLNPDYPEGTTGDWSDHAPFRKAGIPYAYFESTNWAIGDKDGYIQTVKHGAIMHTGKDNLDFIEKEFPGRAEERLHTFVSVLANLLLYMDEPIYKGMMLSGNMASMTEERVFDVAVDFGYVPDLDNIEWTFGGVPFEEWKKIDYSSGSEIEDSFIKFETEPYLDGKTVKASIRFELPFGSYIDGEWVEVDALERRPYPRTYYPKLIGIYDLAAEDKDKNTVISEPIKLNAYDSYHTWEEIKPAIDEIFLKAKDDRYLEYKVLGKSTEGRDMHHVILAKNKEAVDTYLNKILPMMKENPGKLQKMIEKGTIGDYKVPIFFNNIHPDEATAVDVIIKLLEKFATEDILTYKDYETKKVPMTEEADGKNMEDPSTGRIITVDVDEALENVILLFNFTENPDGRYYNTRQNVNGFDVNRDNGYQTQIESRLVTAEIAKWSPISMLDFHGFVDGFLIEPCTPPHEPNYEYDLLIENMLEQSHLMGRAGIANTKYESYLIPYEDFAGGWDDGTPAYTATYSMFHGAMASTIEMPDLNEESLNASYYAGVACVNYVMTNKDRLFHNQLEIFKRGVENIDDRKVDPYLVDGEGNSVGRPRGENKNFFPDYYVIPVDKNMQRNILEAYNIAEYLLRNDVRVEVLKEPVTNGGITYPAGSFIVPMNQAKRSYANCVLYDGFDASDFSEMYAEVIMNFHDTRGFDRYIVRKKGLFKGKTEQIYQVTIPERTDLPPAKYYVIKNSNNDAVRVVNKLLKENKWTGMILEDGEGYSKGDFLIHKSDLDETEGFVIQITPTNEKPSIMELSMPKVEAIGGAYTHLGFALRQLGFELVDEDSNIIVGTTGNSVVNEAIKQGKSYVGIGASALNFAKSNNLIPGLEYSSTRHKGLLNCKINANHLITAGYREEETLYNPQGAYITNVGEGTVLTKVVDRDDFFKAGWWPDKSVVRGKILSVTKKIGEANVTLFANNIVNKAHPQKEWRMLANAIFTSVPANTSENFQVILENVPDSFNLDSDASVKAIITNNSDTEKEALLIVALYHVDTETLVSYAAASEVVKAGGQKTLYASLRIPETGNYRVKTFVWDSWENGKPLADVLTVPVQ